MSEEHASVRDWTDILRRIRFGATVRVPGTTRGVRGATLRAVALMLATYADGDGSRVFPGTARIAVACEIDYRTAKRCLAALRWLGLIALTRAARRRQLADEYRLTIPSNLLDRLEVLTPAAMDLEIERIREGNRRREPKPTNPDGARTGVAGTRTDDAVRGADAPVQPVDNPPARVPDAPVDTPPGETGTGAGSTASDASTGAGSTFVRVPECPPTHHDLDTTTTHHPQRNLRSKPAGPRAREAEEPDSDVVDEQPPPGPLRVIEGNPAAPDTATRGIWPAAVPADPEPAATPRGHGFCLPCHAQGRYTVAADPTHGTHCTLHLRSA